MPKEIKNLTKKKNTRKNKWVEVILLLVVGKLILLKLLLTVMQINVSFCVCVFCFSFKTKELILFLYYQYCAAFDQ